MILSYIICSYITYCSTYVHGILDIKDTLQWILDALPVVQRLKDEAEPLRLETFRAGAQNLKMNIDFNITLALCGSVAVAVY